eukprot:UN19162
MSMTQDGPDYNLLCITAQKGYKSEETGSLVEACKWFDLKDDR